MVDTNHFKGNFPESVLVEACLAMDAPDAVSAFVFRPRFFWGALELPILLVSHTQQLHHSLKRRCGFSSTEPFRDVCVTLTSTITWSIPGVFPATPLARDFSFLSPVPALPYSS